MQLLKSQQANSFIVMVWMLTTIMNYMFYSCKFVPSLLISVISLLALYVSYRKADVDDELEFILTLSIWLILTCCALEYMKRSLVTTLLSFSNDMSKDNSDELLANLKEGVVVLDDQDGSILFKNKEASKKLRVKEGGQLKYMFDASIST